MLTGSTVLVIIFIKFINRFPNSLVPFSCKPGTFKTAVSSKRLILLNLKPGSMVPDFNQLDTKLLDTGGHHHC